MGLDTLSLGKPQTGCPRDPREKHIHQSGFTHAGLATDHDDLALSAASLSPSKLELSQLVIVADHVLREMVLGLGKCFAKGAVF